MGAAGGAAAGAAAAAIAQAIKASGAIVRVSPENFERLVARGEAPLVVYAHGGIFKKSHQYLTSYKGLAFFAKSPHELHLPGDVEIVTAQSIWIPS